MGNARAWRFGPSGYDIEPTSISALVSSAPRHSPRLGISRSPKSYSQTLVTRRPHWTMSALNDWMRRRGPSSHFDDLLDVEGCEYYRARLIRTMSA